MSDVIYNIDGVVYNKGKEIGERFYSFRDLVRQAAA